RAGTGQSGAHGTGPSGPLSPSHVRRAWDSLVRSRALVLDEMARRHRSIGSTSDPETARLASDLSVARGRLAHLIVRGPGSSSPPDYRALLDTARDKSERVERALAEKSAVVAAEIAMARAGIDDVITMLPDDAALIAFARYEHFAPGRSEAAVGSTPS